MVVTCGVRARPQVRARTRSTARPPTRGGWRQRCSALVSAPSARHSVRLTASVGAPAGGISSSSCPSARRSVSAAPLAAPDARALAGKSSKSSDVFSFAIIMWEVLTWQVPYTGYFSVQVRERKETKREGRCWVRKREGGQTCSSNRCRRCRGRGGHAVSRWNACTRLAPPVYVCVEVFVWRRHLWQADHHPTNRIVRR